MNRHLRYTLLTPLAVASVALAPALAHAASAEQVSDAPAAAPLAPACKLENGSSASEYDIILTGFTPNQKVKIVGAENINTAVDQQGAFTEQDVKKGTYHVEFGGGKKNKNQQSVNCTKPARVTPVHISDVDITSASTTPAVDVDCSVAQSVTFKATLTGTGTGDTTVRWSSSTKSSNPVVKFTAPTTETTFVAKSAPRAAATAPAPKVFASVVAGDASDTMTFTLKCKP
ncbi:hypothetical protein [Streptomyces vietnamensis]|uniref:Ig-like domain-containing protein n=1 Tax=Streptomyces vietnamensis TaxID=362257 RepID=A0A0B5HZI4_9ACTN|nr:hypothetical protein [Streptomyces vietnamensis]AJF63687.1 hypothetical protein SVTN_03630 [Streptomyces vietnamensis]